MTEITYPRAGVCPQPMECVLGVYPLSIMRCPAYDPEMVREALKALLEPLGGIEAFVRPGQTVLLKPNMLGNKKPEEAVTTHPVIVEEVARLCQKQGATVYIGDSPPMTLRKIEEYWAATGYQKVAAATGARLLAFEKEPRREITLSSTDGEAFSGLPRKHSREKIRIHVTDWYFKADVVINLPKMKTHNLTVLTGAVKNHFGLLPGIQKPQLHVRFPRPFDFGDLIADIAARIPAHLSIMDGVTGMDGHGPAGGRVIKPGILLASPNPVALDWGFARLVGLDPRKLPVLSRCFARKFGPLSFDQIQVVGLGLDEVKMPGFNAPDTAFFWPFFPDAFLRIARRLIWARPLIEKEKCIKCEICAKVCPARAILINRDEQVISRRTCISCFCCSEVCPEKAITVEGSALFNMALSVRRMKRYLQGRGND